MNAVSLTTPIGPLGIFEKDGKITRLTWRHVEKPQPSSVLQHALSQLRAYFAGELKTVFDLPLAPRGTEFEQKVYREMLAIPFGQTKSYGEIAKLLSTYGQPVGRACGANPIPVIIPCHRVLSANGLGGFSGFGGIEMKAALLKHEDAYPFLI